MENTVYLSSFSGESDSERFNNAAEFLKTHSGFTLIAEPGIYNITNEAGRDTLNKVMSGEYGENPEEIMFMPGYHYGVGISFRGLSDVHIKADGVKLMTDGFMEPVEIRECRNVTLTGLTIDHKRKPYSKGKITAVNLPEKTLTVEFFPEYPVYEKTPMPRAVLFDLERNRLYDYGNIHIVSKKMLAPQKFIFTMESVKADYAGCEFYVWHTFHSRPAILIEDCADIHITDVTIHSQPGMGIVAHRDENLYFDCLRVVPSVGEHMSTNTDATHITSCKGILSYNNCVFEGQGDDALNVHTYYHSIERLSDTRARLILRSPTGTHSSSADYPDAGDILELTVDNSLKVTDAYTVKAVKNISPFESEIEVDKKLPEDCAGLSFADATRCPKLIYRNNYSRSHLARGILVKTKNAVIENNTFTDIVGTAIYVAAESWWKEGVCSTENIVIRNNRIITCGRTDDIRQFDTAGICVSFDADDRSERTHKSVLIEDNIIDCPHSPRGIYAANIINAAIIRNSVVCKTEGIITENCGEIIEDGNTVILSGLTES